MAAPSQRKFCTENRDFFTGSRLLFSLLSQSVFEDSGKEKKEREADNKPGIEKRKTSCTGSISGQYTFV